MKVKALLWLNRNKIHVLVWISYVLYESVIIAILFNVYAHPLIYIVHSIIIIVYFYVHSDLLLPWSIKNRRNAFWRVPLIVIAQILIYIATHHLVNYLLALVDIVSYNSVKFNTDFIFRNFYRAIYFMAFATGYYFLKNYLNERKKTEKLERERLHNIINKQKIEQELSIAQNAYLKAQINPHFLFNTLDFVYHNVNKHSEVAGDTIIRLAEMMRFAIDSDQMEGTIELIEEIEQVNHLLFLNQVRRNNQLHINFFYSDNVEKVKIIPLVLLTLTENIFKHGDLTNAASPARIAITLDRHQLYIDTSNFVNHDEITPKSQSGLINIKKRLIYAYNNQARFDYHIDNNRFVVNIAIPIALLK
jgi:two-component system LytT family sensor kinase